MKKQIVSLLTLALLVGCHQAENLTSIDGASDKFHTLINYVQDDRIEVHEMTELKDNKFYFISFENKQPSKYNLYSISKNFTSIAMGILLDQNLITLDISIYDIFKDDYQMDPCWKNVQLKHVLNQTTGIDKGFLDVDQDDPSTFGTDYLKTILDTLPIYEPGTHFQYSDSNYILISRIIYKVTKTHTQDFIKKNILDKLEITDYKFQNDPQNNFLGATGLYISSVSLAKFGLMIKNKGLYKENRIVSENYIDEATSQIFETGGGTYYGYSFWSDVGIHAIRGSGMLGQILYINLDNDVITTVLSNDEINLTNELLTELQY